MNTALSDVSKKYSLISMCLDNNNFRGSVGEMRRKRSKTTNKRGFTLIELLVVIAIISLLVSILLPSLSRARDLAKTVVCLSNVRSHLMGINVYSADNDGSYPAAFGGGLQTDTNKPGAYFLTSSGMNTPNHFISWMDLIYDDGGLAAFQCPMSTTKMRTLSEASSQVWDGTSEEQGYGYNRYLSGLNQGDPSPLNVTDVESPAETFAVMDYHRVYGPNAHLYTGYYVYYNVGRLREVAPHDEQTNFGMADGHAETLHYLSVPAMGGEDSYWYWR